MLKNNIAVIGLQWGDEGKGKIVDYLSADVDIVVRYHGSSNAGHTIKTPTQTYVLRILPTGILRNKVKAVISSGVVIDPYVLVQEIAQISMQTKCKITSANLLIAENCHLVLSIHKYIDKMYEQIYGKRALGTTEGGIGPCYEDKVGRRGITLADLYDKSILINKLERLLLFHNALRRGIQSYKVNKEALLEELMNITPQVMPYVVPYQTINNLCKDSRAKILFEGAQGVCLDIDHGTYPFVTSSSTISHEGLYKNCNSLGIIKAYTTRVGNGPFPTEQRNDLGNYLSQQGREIGSVTGRKRRCGWFDAVLVRYAAQVSSISSLVLTKLDILDKMEVIKICTHYTYRNESYNYLPVYLQDKVVAQYEALPGWCESTYQCTDFACLPRNAQRYIIRIEELVGIRISMISTGPERDSLIIR